jgi:uncharacterized membrane protein
MEKYLPITESEKNSILQKHSSFYNGYSVGNVPNNTNPLLQDDGPSDTNGITINNKGKVKTYTNHLVNEEKMKVIEDGIDFPPKFVDEEEDYSYSEDSYDEDVDGDEEYYSYSEDSYDEDVDGDEEDYSYSENSYDKDVDGINSAFMKLISNLPTNDEDEEEWDEEEWDEEEWDEEEWDEEEWDEEEWDEEEDIDLYEEEVYEGETCEVCGGEMMEGECIECGGLYENLDEDLIESLKVEKSKINEMFKRFDRY